MSVVYSGVTSCRAVGARGCASLAIAHVVIACGGATARAGADAAAGGSRQPTEGGVVADAMIPNPDSGDAAHEPVVLADVPFPGVSSFAIDGTSLYWTTSYTGT